MALRRFEDYPSIRTPLSAENLNFNFDELERMVKKSEIDTGWKNFVFHNPNFEQMNGMQTAQYRRLGDFFYLRGMITCAAQSNSNEEMCKVQLEDVDNVPKNSRYFHVASYMGEASNNSKNVILTMDNGIIKVHFSDVRSWLSLDGIVLII